MTLIQPILVLLVALGLLFYQLKGRSRLLDRGIVFSIAAAGVILIVDPQLSMKIANALGVGRGVDLVIYLGMTGFAFLFLLIFSKLRALESQITSLVRTIAIQQAVDGAQTQPPPAAPAGKA